MSFTGEEFGWAEIRIELLNGLILVLLAGSLIYTFLIRPLLRHQRRAMEAETGYETIIATSMDAFWIADCRGNITYVNDSFVSMIGFSREELLKMSIPDIEATESSSDTTAHIMKIMRDGYDRFETRHKRKDGALIDVEVSTNYLPDKGGRFFVFMRDITDRKASERKLLTSSSTLSDAQRIAHVGNWEWDIASGTLTWSDEIYRIFGLAPQEFAATYEAFLGRVHAEDRIMVEEAVKDALAGATSYDIEHRILLPGGMVRHVHEIAEVFRDSRGAPLKMIGTVQDITERKEAEDSMRKANALLEAIHYALSTFITEKDTGEMFKGLLESFLSLTASESGFIGEVIELPSGERRLLLHAFSHEHGFDKFLAQSLLPDSKGQVVLCNRSSLVTEVVNTMDFVVSNDVGVDARKGGTPDGHPPLRSFLGIPLNVSDRILGVAGVANRPGGYDEDLIEYLTPLIIATANAIESYTNNQERQEALNALTVSSADLANAQRIAQVGSWHWDVARNEQRWSAELCRILGIEPDSVRETFAEFLEFVHHEDRERVMRAVYDAMEIKKPYSIEHRVVRAGGEVRMVQAEGEVTFDASGAPERMMGTMQDITERKKAEAELRKLSMAIEQSVNIIFITGDSGVIEYVNPTFERVTGFARGEAIGMTPAIFASGETPRATYRTLWETVLDGRTWRGTFKNRRKDGRPYWVNCLITPMMGDDGRIAQFIAIQEDITERVLAEERVKYLSDFDRVTGLLNRERFVSILEERTLAAVPSDAALLMVDIDGFKFINDRYGHAKGDALLSRVGAIIRDTLMETETFGGAILARPGEDSFAVFIEPCTHDEAVITAERLRRAVETAHDRDEFSRPTVSIGIVLSPHHGATPRDLLANADTAVHRAKEMGRNRCHMFSPEDSSMERMEAALHTKGIITSALEDDRFAVWYQPILDIRPGDIHHYEALARIKDTDSTILNPISFIPTAEKFGLVGAIDRTIIRKTFARQADASSKGRHINFSVNLSGKSFVDETILDYIRRMFSSTGADPRYIVFEITETEAIGDLSRAMRLVGSLKHMGSGISLDDFGVGFTSFTYLRELKVDYIKIDGSFIKDLPSKTDDQLLVGAMADMARGLGIKSIGEYVEARETLRLLTGMGVDYAQGYLIGKPMPDILDSHTAA